MNTKLYFIKVMTFLFLCLSLSISQKANAFDGDAQKTHLDTIEQISNRYALILDISNIGPDVNGAAKVQSNNQKYYYACSAMLTEVLQEQGYEVVCFKANDFTNFNWEQLEAKLDASVLKNTSSTKKECKIFVFVTAFGVEANNQEGMYIYSPVNVKDEQKGQWGSMSKEQLDAESCLVSIAQLDKKIRDFGFHKNVTIYNFLSDTTTRDATGKAKVRAIDAERASKCWQDEKEDTSVPQFYYQHIYLKNQSPDNSTANNIYKTLFDGLSGCADAMGTLNKVGELSNSDGYVDANELLEYLRIQYGEQVVYGEKISANTVFLMSQSRYSTNKLSNLIDEATASMINEHDKEKAREYKQQFLNKKKTNNKE